MMQPSDLDKKILPLSPSLVKKQNRTSDPTVRNHLSAVPKCTSSQINSQEMSPKDLSKNDQSWTAQIPKTDVPEIQSEDKLTTDEANSNGQSLPVATTPETESPKLDGSGSGGEAVSANVTQQGFLPVLKNPNFLALWGGQVFSQLADKVYLVLMIALINTQFQASNQSISGWVSVLMMAFTIPAVLFGSVAGVFVIAGQKRLCWWQRIFGAASWFCQFPSCCG